MKLPISANFHFKSLRWKLITSVAVVHAVMMSLFVWDLVHRQQQMLFERQREHAKALSHTLATSSAHWLVSYDLAGLQEMINTQKHYPELNFALLTDIDGKILAHSDKSKIGLYVTDMPETPVSTVISSSKSLCDAAVPAMLAGQHIGWARVGIGQKIASRKLANIIRDGVIYTVIAIVIGSIIAWFMGKRITKRLYAIQNTIGKIKAGNKEFRTRLSGDDEATILADEFNNMLDTICRREEELQTSEKKLKQLNTNLEKLVEEKTKELRDSLKQAEKAKKELELAQRVAHLGSWALDIPNNVLIWSNEAYRMFGIGPDTSLTIEKFFSFIHPDDRDIVETAWLSALQGERYNIEHRIIVNEQIKWVHEQAELNFNEKGEAVFGIGTVKDITDRKHIEEMLEQAKQKAEEMSRYKSEFLANMSHELRTPLNSILLLSKNLAENKDSNLTPKQVERASTVYSSGSELLAMINDVLDLSKIEAGKMDLQFEDIYLDDICEAMEKIFRPVAENKHLDFQIRKAAFLPDTINTDSMRLMQILKNLLSNAFKFTKTGGVTLEIFWPASNETSARSNIDHSIAFSVKDTGPGIPEDKHELVFQAFKQADGSTSRTHGGTGLGLSLSREFACLLGGDLDLVSKVGKGTVFTLYIPQTREKKTVQIENHKKAAGSGHPLVDTSSPPITSAARSTKENQVEITAKERYKDMTYLPGEKKKIIRQIHDREAILENKKILIVDDDMRNVYALISILHDKGSETLVASNGREALMKIRKNPDVDLVIMDIMMPEMDGYEAMTEIRKLDGNISKIPIIALTAKAMKGDRAECIRKGASDYLSKPVDEEKLFSMLRMWLNN